MNREASDWRTVLGLFGKLAEDDIEMAWRRLAKLHHPDAGSTTAAMSRINAARDAALADLRKSDAWHRAGGKAIRDKVRGVIIA